MASRNGSDPCRRCHIVLVPGFGGFDALGRVEYYAGITRLFQNWKRRHMAHCQWYFTISIISQLQQ